MSSLCKAAQWYAEYGWPVFPLRRQSKGPYKGIGMYQATTDAAQIEQWWQFWPEANIGLHVGGADLIAVDADTYKDAYAGDSLISPADEETITNLTGNGGAHLLYAVPDGKRYGNKTGDLPRGIDIRGWGGYILLPPSVHPNGKRYQWEAGYGPHEMLARYAPDALLDALERARTNVVSGPPDEAACTVGAQLVDQIMIRLNIVASSSSKYDDTGWKWILRDCPFAPPDDPHAPDKAAFIIIWRDGKIVAGCQHERCRRRLHDMQVSGWRFLVQRWKENERYD